MEPKAGHCGITQCIGDRRLSFTTLIQIMLGSTYGVDGDNVTEDFGQVAAMNHFPPVSVVENTKVILPGRKIKLIRYDSLPGGEKEDDGGDDWNR